MTERIYGRYGRGATPLGHALLVLALLLPALLAGCGDDGNPADPGDGSGTVQDSIRRATIDSLITVFFPVKYSERDSAGYEEMLDDRFTFEKLRSEDDQPGQDLFWDKHEELMIAGRMFKGWVNPDGQSVESITANILVTETRTSGDSDQPDDEEWFDVEAIVDLVFVVRDPSITDGTGIINFLIDSNQDFIVTRDSGDPGLWVIVKQMDKEQIRKGLDTGEPREPREHGATENASWSDIKDLFR